MLHASVVRGGATRPNAVFARTGGGLHIQESGGNRIIVFRDVANRLVFLFETIFRIMEYISVFRVEFTQLGPYGIVSLHFHRSADRG
jgi:hypothetical protein